MRPSEGSENMIQAVLSRFPLGGDAGKVQRFGSGLINDTYLCEFGNGRTVRKYILQKINTAVFKHPVQVMENVEAVTTYIVNRLRERGVPDPYRVTPALVFTREGRSYHQDKSGAYWRVFHFIEQGKVFDSISDSRQAFQVGRGLGKFQALVSGMAPAGLHDTLPGFHHTPRYLGEYDKALAADTRGRVSSVEPEIAFVSQRRVLAHLLTDRIEHGEVPVRVVHNDPKVNNIMLDAATGEAICMLDLDTVKPGIVHFDFGDCLRSAGNRAGEDAPQLENVRLDLDVFAAVTEGYLREAGLFLTQEEIELLPASVKVITFELGLRFLTDYLLGDTYFKTRYSTHNLHRARVQFKLLESVEAAEKKMALIIDDAKKRTSVEQEKTGEHSNNKFS